MNYFRIKGSVTSSFFGGGSEGAQHISFLEESHDRPWAAASEEVLLSGTSV